MRKTTFAIVVLAAFVLTSCGGDTAESVSKDMVANMKEMGTILSGITDEASAKAAVPKIEALRVKMRECGQRAKNVLKPDAATEQKIEEAMRSGMQEAMMSIGVAQERLMSRPELMAIIEPAMQNMDQDL